MKRNTRILAVMAIVCASTFSKAHAQNTSPYWSLAGNSNTTTSSKLGTTNGVSLRFYAGNVQRMMISYSNGNVGIGTTHLPSRLNINAASGSSPFVAQINGTTKLFAASNGGLSVGSGATPPASGLYVNGAVGIGTTVPDAGVKLKVVGRGLFTNIPADFNGYPDSSARDYGITVKSATGGLYGESVPDDLNGRNYPGVYGAGSVGVVGFGPIGVQGEVQVGDPNGTGIGVQGISNFGTAVEGIDWDFGTAVHGSSASMGVRGDGVNYGVVGYAGAQDYSQYGGESTPASEDGVGGYFYSEIGDGLHSGTGSSTKFAGVFTGDVYASGVYQSSDKNLKQNVQKFQNAMSLINKLKPRNYEFRTDEKLKVLNLPKGIHYGLIAQDVAEVLPNLVKEVQHNLNPPKPQDITARTAKLDKTTTGEQQPKRELPKPEILTTKAVNYIELIPIMIKGMQEQEAEIKAKDEKIADLEARLEKLETIVNRNSNLVTSISGAYLEQNTPNPASGTTLIRYHVPATATAAYLTVTNAKGQLVKTIAINGNSSGQVNLNSTMLAAGTYNYTLYVDGKPVDNKRLVIAR